jgi:hypothetical protein
MHPLHVKELRFAFATPADSAIKADFVPCSAGEEDGCG